MRIDLASKYTPIHREIHSFPTRRSSDLAKSMIENADENTHAQAEQITLDNALNGAEDLPMHPGAAKYYEEQDRKSTRLNSSHVAISYAVFCLKKKKDTYEGYNCKTKSKQ